MVISWPLIILALAVYAAGCFIAYRWLVAR